jgi:hypothetical protein
MFQEFRALDRLTKVQQVPTSRERAYPLNNNRLNSILLPYLSSQVFRLPLAGHVIDSDIGALLGELDTDQFAQAPAACPLLVKHESAIVNKSV